MRRREEIEAQFESIRNPQMQNSDQTIQDVHLEVLLDIRDILIELNKEVEKSENEK